MGRARVLGARSPRPLEGAWEIAALPPGRAEGPEDLSRIDVDWLACDRPMPAAAALRARGKWDLDHPRDFDLDDWWYRCTFAGSDPGLTRRLRFDGLATVADVWLNGAHILHSDNMFVSNTVDLASPKPPGGGGNELVIKCHALAPMLASKRPRPRWRAGLVTHQGLRWHRTSLLGRMPAWCPPVAPVGPWRPISIDDSSLWVERSDVKTNVEPSGGAVRVSLTVRCASATGLSPRGTLRVGTHHSSLTCRQISGTAWRVDGETRVTAVERWWPHTHGAQPLYDVRATLDAGDDAIEIDLGRVGFRTLALDRDGDGRGFGLIVNGTPVFCRGACWTPLDLAHLVSDRAAYATALEQFRDAGINMVRITGATVYEVDAFHDLCDELGLLVWQDFMFASMDYPWDDPVFADNALTEAAQVLDALQPHPSLAVVCGNSEVDQQAAMLGLPEARRSAHASESRLGELVHAAVPDAMWIPTSPCGGTWPFQVNAGVSHYYGVGAYRRPLDDARRAGVRFAAESLAFSNVPDPSTLRLIAGDGDTPGDDRRWKATLPRDPVSDGDFEEVRDHYLAQLFRVDPVAVRQSDWQRYLALGRIATAEAMLRTFAEWRRPGSSCRGGLVWFARDLEPSAGWGIIDSTGRPKAAYWYLKRALAPVTLLCADEGLNGLWLHALNDTAGAIEAELRVALYYRGLRRGVAATTSVTVPARGHCSVHADALFDGFLDLTYAYKFGPPGHDVVACTLRDASNATTLATAHYFPGPLPSEDVGTGLTARAEPEGDAYVVVLESDRFAHAVSIDADGWIADDNYLHLEPGDARRVRLRCVDRTGTCRGVVSALNSGARVPIDVVEAVHAR
jgi:beta-mannosidase